ncbi:MAG: hypothetical protein GY863_25245, partial [bacterium]|nr:hypothetical protein [bacterium]
MILKVFKYKTAESRTGYGIFCDKAPELCYLDFKTLYLKYKPETDAIYLAHLRTVDILNIINEDNEFVEFCTKIAEDPSPESDLYIPEGFSYKIPAEPSKIIAIARNYALHAKESGAEVSEEPVFFAKLVSSLIAHLEAV